MSETAVLNPTTFPLIAYGSRVFVIESKLTGKTAGGLYLPDSQREIIATDGIVVAIGDDVTFCTIGDRIYYARYSGATCTIDNLDYRIMNEEDILGKWRKEGG